MNLWRPWNRGGGTSGGGYKKYTGGKEREKRVWPTFVPSFLSTTATVAGGNGTSLGGGQGDSRGRGECTFERKRNGTILISRNDPSIRHKFQRLEKSSSKRQQRIPVSPMLPVQLIISSPPSSAFSLPPPSSLSIPPSSSLSIPPTYSPIKSAVDIQKIKDCSVRLTRLTCQEIEQSVCRRHTTPLPLVHTPPPRISPGGKQLHLLLKRPRGRGRPRKDGNKGQCVVRSSSKSMMKLKIIKMSRGPGHYTSLKQQSPFKRSIIDMKAGNAIAAALVESGYFDQFLLEKSKSVRKRVKKLMPTTPRENHNGTATTVTTNFHCTPTFLLLKKSERAKKRDMKNMPTTPRKNHDGTPITTGTSNVHCTLFPCRTLFMDENTPGESCVPTDAAEQQNKTQSNNVQYGPVTPTLFKENTSSSGVAFQPEHQMVEKVKRSLKGGDNMNPTLSAVLNNVTTCDDGNNWVNELFSTNLASEVVQEALGDFYIPDISFIQDLTEESGDTIAVPSTSEQSPSKNVVSSSTSTLESHDYFEIIDITSPNESADESEMLKLEPREIITPEERLRKLELYEHFFNNDILMIHPDDDELPFPY